MISTTTPRPHNDANDDATAATSSRHHQQAAPPASRVVPKPVPKAQHDDPRAYQLNQLRRRYAPREAPAPDNATTTALRFHLKPSDPDFPFELDHLDCELRVPKHYPRDDSPPPTLLVLNKDMPRGFAINVERGWDRLVAERKGAATTLLALLNALDKHLEQFLTEQKAETVKMTIFKDTRHLEATTATAIGSQPPMPEAAAADAAAPPPPRRTYVPDETYYTKDEIAQAKARRSQETRVLDARMSRLPHYHKSYDGIVYTLPMESKRRYDLPAGLRAVNSLQLVVPVLYPLQPPRILLNDVDSEDAEGVEELFVERARDKKDMNLMFHINSLTQNIHLLAKESQERKKGSSSKQPVAQDPQGAATATEADAGNVAQAVENKGNVHVIPRPPEWYTDGEEEDDDDDESGHDSYESTDSEDEDGGASLGLKKPAPTRSLVASPPEEKGIAMSFPHVELHQVELLQVTSLALSVKCQRCKTKNEIGGLEPNVAKTSESCRKCATAFALTFRSDLVHAHSTRAGFIDTEGCTVADMLPSSFLPTCGRCSTPPALSLVSVRGNTITNVCHECHGRFTFKIPEVKFLAYTPGSGVLPPTSGPRRRQERLGLHAGEPLPDKGACQHYRKSYRWFRFSCCNKVHACDRCHDEAENHLNEWANRMICGYCSREQNYAVTNCGFCGRSVVGRRGRGFWEGGKGTRDRKLMSRKDPRKFKRIGGAGAEANKKKD